MLDEHGSYSIKAKNNILYIECVGTWNEETALNYKADIISNINKFNGKNWASVCILDNWNLNTPEVVPVLQEIVLTCVKQKLKRLAHVYLNSDIKDYFLNEMFLTSYPDYERAVFSTKEQALSWLKESGYTID